MVKRVRVGLPLLLGLGSVIFACSAQANLKGNLTVEVNGLRNQTGLLCIKVFNGSQGFPDGNAKALKQDCVKITESPMKFNYRGFPAGSYAVAVFHDANGDRKLNRNSAGMPTEGYGFSKNPVVNAGPPKFGQAVFLIAGPNTKVNIQMKYGS